MLCNDVQEGQVGSSSANRQGKLEKRISVGPKMFNLGSAEVSKTLMIIKTPGNLMQRSSRCRNISQKMAILDGH